MAEGKNTKFQALKAKFSSAGSKIRTGFSGISQRMAGFRESFAGKTQNFTAKAQVLANKAKSAGGTIKSGAKKANAKVKSGASKVRTAVAPIGGKFTSFKSKVANTMFRTDESVAGLRDELNKQVFWFADETSGKHMVDRWPFGHGKYVENLTNVIDDKFYGVDFDAAKRVYNFEGVFGKDSNFETVFLANNVLENDDIWTSASLLANGFNSKSMLGKMRDMELNKSATQKRLNTISGRKNYAPNTDDWAELALNEDSMSVYDYQCLLSTELCAKNPVLLESRWLDQEVPSDYTPPVLGEKQLKDFPHMAVIENFDDIMRSVAKHTNINIKISDSVEAGQVALYKKRFFSSLRGIKNYAKKAGNARASGVRANYTMAVSSKNTQGEQIYMTLKALSEVSVKHFIDLTEQAIAKGAENLPSAEQFNQDKDSIARIASCLIASDMCYMFNLEKNDADVLSNAFMVEALLNFDNLTVSEDNKQYMPLIADYYAESINSFAQDFQVSLTSFAESKGVDVDATNIGNILYARMVPTATNVLGEPTIRQQANKDSNFLYEQMALQQQRVRDEQEKARKEAEAKRKADEEAKRKAEEDAKKLKEQQEAQERQQRAEEEMRQSQENLRKQQEAENQQQANDEAVKKANAERDEALRQAEEIKALYEHERYRRLSAFAQQKLAKNAERQEAIARRMERLKFYAEQAEQKRKNEELTAKLEQEREAEKQAHLANQELASQARQERDKRQKDRQEILDRYYQNGDYRTTKTSGSTTVTPPQNEHQPRIDTDGHEFEVIFDKNGLRITKQVLSKNVTRYIREVNKTDIMEDFQTKDFNNLVTNSSRINGRKCTAKEYYVFDEVCELIRNRENLEKQLSRFDNIGNFTKMFATNNSGEYYFIGKQLCTIAVYNGLRMPINQPKTRVINGVLCTEEEANIYEMYHTNVKIESLLPKVAQRVVKDDKINEKLANAQNQANALKQAIDTRNNVVIASKQAEALKQAMLKNQANKEQAEMERKQQTADNIGKMAQAQAEAEALKQAISANDKLMEEAQKEVADQKGNDILEPVIDFENVDIVKLAQERNAILEKERLERERLERERQEAEELEKQKNIEFTPVGLPDSFYGFERGDKSKCPTSVMNMCQEYVANAVSKNWIRQYQEGKQVIEALRTAEGVERTMLSAQAKELYIERELSANVGFIMDKVSGKRGKCEHPEFDDLSKYAVEHEVVNNLQKVAESLAKKVVEFRQANADKLGEKFTTATFKQYIKAEGGKDVVVKYLDDKAVNIILNNGFYSMLRSDEEEISPAVATDSGDTYTTPKSARVATLDEFQ